MSDTQKRSADILTARLVLMGLFIAVACVYFPWRLTVFNPASPVFSAVFFAVELVGFMWGIVFLVSVLKISPPQTLPVAPGIAVDVFIPTYNEPVDIVRRTAAAAMRISYPHETWILDDGNRPAMRAMADELGCRYIARAENTHAKAGNLNNALKHAKGEFIALFDADFIAEPRFLDRTLGYFADPKIAFVQPPQEYYNFDSYQYVGSDRAHNSWSEHSLFYRVIQAGRDVYNGTMFCGCSAVLRRAAIDSVGGIATGTVTEDMHTSVRLHNAGWDSAFHAETLSAGLSPHDADGFRRQRLRWAQGAMQVFRKEKLITGAKGLSPFQRLAYLMHVIAHMEGLRHAFIYLTPIVTLGLGMSPFRLDLTFQEWAMFSLPTIVLGIFCFEEFARGHARILRNELFNLARCPSSIHAMLALIDKRHIPFRVTSKVKDGPRGFMFPWFILAATLVAIVKALWEVWHGTAMLTGWPLVTVMTWATLSAMMAVGVCLLTHRCDTNRRFFSRFPAALPVTLQPENGAPAVRALVTEISDGGLTLGTVDGGELPAGRVTGALKLCGQEAPFTLNLQLREGRAGGGTLIWKNELQRDHYLHLILVDRIRFLATFDDVEQKTYLGWLLPRRTPQAQLQE
ncbi:MAG: glycosyltransferase [bacterium]|nr:glycosyltransferase [bacterium]